MSSAQYCLLTKLDKLLLATDRSPFSTGAEQEAVNFAKRCSSHLYVVSIMESNPEYETIGSAFFEKEEEEIIKYLKSFKENASREGINCETFFLHGTTVLIGKDGKIKRVWNNVKVKGHVDEVLRELEG